MSHPSELSGVFGKPFPEQVAFFRRKLARQVPTTRWDELLGVAHDDAFMVAGAVKADLLSDLAAAVDKAIAEGRGIAAFRDDFDAIVRQHGWTGWAGEGSVKGEAWRVGVILRTNAYTSYAAGRMAQLREGNFAFWVYRHGGSIEPRPNHLSWDGWAGPPEHPFWITHYPPSDWGCSCYVVGARTAAGVRRLGGDPGKKLPANWQQRDPKTGAPMGIGKGWDYAPGGSVSQVVTAMARKITNWDYGVGRAFMRDLPTAQADAVAQAYRALPSTADDARRFALAAQQDQLPGSDVRTLGALTSTQATEIGAVAGENLATFDFRVSQQAVRHVYNFHGDQQTEALRGQRAVTADDFGLLPRIISAPDAIEGPDRSEVNELLVHLVKEIDGDRFTATFAVARRFGTLSLKTMFVRPRRAKDRKAGPETGPEAGPKIEK